MNKPKPFAISKQVVWDAYQRVKANDGAAGVDGATITEFERDLKDNLYKLWNRMSRLLRLPAGTVRAAGCGSLPGAVLESRLGY